MKVMLIEYYTGEQTEYEAVIDGNNHDYIVEIEDIYGEKPETIIKDLDDLIELYDAYSGRYVTYGGFDDRIKKSCDNLKEDGQTAKEIEEALDFRVREEYRKYSGLDEIAGQRIESIIQAAYGCGWIE